MLLAILIKKVEVPLRDEIDQKHSERIFGDVVQRRERICQDLLVPVEHTAAPAARVELVELEVDEDGGVVGSDSCLGLLDVAHLDGGRRAEGESGGGL